MRLRVYLLPFFGEMALSQVTAGQVQEYRIWRHEETIKKRGKPPARSTIHQEIVVLRQTLKAAVRHGWLDRLPDLSEPYKKSGKVSHRAWFSPGESSNSMRPPGAGRATRSGPAIVGNQSSSMITCSSWPIPACGRMKPTALNTVT